MIEFFFAIVDAVNSPGALTVVGGIGSGAAMWALRKLVSIERRLTRIETKLNIKTVSNDE